MFLFPRELSVPEDQLSNHMTIRTWLLLEFTVIKSNYFFNKFTTGQRRVSNHSTVSHGPAPPLWAKIARNGTRWGAATSMKRGAMTLLGVPQGQSHSLLLAKSTGCLCNMPRGGETGRALQSTAAQGGKRRLCLWISHGRRAEKWCSPWELVAWEQSKCWCSRLVHI